MSASNDLAAMDLQQLIAIVFDDWTAINPDAATYLQALDSHDCAALNDRVGNETAELQVRYFLTHAGQWRGPVARSVKAELRKRLS